MKRLALVLICLLAFCPASAAQLLTIHAGDGFTLTLQLGSKTSGAPVSISLYNGVKRIDWSVTTGEGGTVAFNVPAGVVTSAGQSLIVIRAGGETLRQPLAVLPDAVAQVDFVSTSHTLTAYGDAQAMVVALLDDRYGSPIDRASDLTLTARYPEGAPRTVPMRFETGLAWTWLPSDGAPGRLRLLLESGDITRALELNQIAGDAAQLTLDILPSCVLDDGRDVLTLRARVLDAHGAAVADSTAVRFSWPSGYGTAQTDDGSAMLRLPAPTQAGQVAFTATSAGASAQAVLIVRQDACP